MEADRVDAGGRILVVDDEEGVREMFKALLTVAGYDVLTQSSGDKALDYLESHLNDAAILPVDLVILDILMPGLSGREVCRRIKAHSRLRYVPILMVTALGSIQDRIEGVDIGADDYVAKPFRTEELLVRVRALLRISQIQRELLERNIELASLRNFNEGILQNMGNGLLTVDLDGRITALNPAASQMLGLDQHQSLAKELDRLQGEMAPLARLMAQTVQTAKPLSHQDFSISTGDGRVVPLRVNTTLLRDEMGGPSGAICVLEDLTEIRAMEEEQRRLDRLAVLGQMSATVAHEIRNPLLTLSLGIQYLEKTLGRECASYEAVQRLRRQVDRLTQIMNEFLAFSRPPQLDLKEHDLLQVLDRVLDAAALGFSERNMSIDWECPQGLFVQLDAEHMERAITNLTFNAMDAMSQGGNLQVRALTMPTQEWVADHPDAQPTPYTPEVVLLQFRDTGSGIAPENLARIFEPFFTTKSKGTGLGLAIVQRTIEEHGGHIQVESRIGEGTTFTISLPRRMA